MLKTRHLEGIVKGFANHRRIQIMELLESNPELKKYENNGYNQENYRTGR